MFSTRITTTALLTLPLTAVFATSGCGSKKTTASAAAPTHHGATSAGSGTPSHSSGAGASKTCPAGDTRATINGATKCLTAGQQCSSKAISQYTQYGFVCRKQTNGYLLSRRT